MSNILQNVDSRTNLVGHNRLELLMFRLKGRQTYAINVFKVQEVLTLPKVTCMPGSNPVIIGVIYLRGRSISVIDLNLAIKGKNKSDILSEFKKRILNTSDKEFNEAVSQVIKIANLRLNEFNMK